MKFSKSLVSLYLVTVATKSSSSCQAFQIGSAKDIRLSNPLFYSRQRSYDNYYQDSADMMELMVGGPKYEMVPLPDSMMDTTLFVGNLCEFCKDEDLSDLFQIVSSLQSVPACVARKPNYTSLRYGFVTFLTIEEKEAAIMRFHGTTFKGRSIKVEEIRDHPKMGRVKVPERIVSYVVGQAKRVNNNSGSISSLRSIARMDPQKQKNNPPVSAKQIEKRRRQKEQRKLQAQLRFPLTTAQQDELLRASRRGYLTLEGKGQSRDRTLNSLACAHRQYCDERERPQIVLCKAAAYNKNNDKQMSSSASSLLDCLVVDLSPLRLTSAVGSELVDDFLTRWKTQILAAAAKAQMELKTEYRESNCQCLMVPVDDCASQDMDQGISDHIAQADLLETNTCRYTITLSAEDSWATQPIFRLPVVSMGIFEGERSKAKAMAKELAELWDLPMEPLDLVEDELEVRSSSTHKMTSTGKKPRGGGPDRRQRKDENRRNRRNDQRYLNRQFHD